MKIQLIFNDWEKKGVSIYRTPEGVELSMGDFHGGTTFNGEIELSKENEEELKEAISKGFQPVFWITV